MVVRWQVASLAAGLLCSSPGRAAEIAWHAPAECADPRQTVEEAERLLGRSLAGVPGVDFDVKITNDREAEWILTLATLDKRSGERRERTLSGASCGEVTGAAAVALAMVIEASDPSATNSDERVEPLSEPAKVTAPANKEPARSGRAAPTKTRPPRRLQPVLSLSLVGDAGSLPGAAPGGEIGAGLRGEPWQLVGLGALYVGSDRQADGKGADLVLATGGLLGCVRAAGGTVRPLLCVGGEAGWLSGTGVGVKNPRTGGALWAAARVQAGVAVPVGGGFALLAGLGAAIPLVRRPFVIDSGILVHEPKVLAGRLSLGVEFAL